MTAFPLPGRRRPARTVRRPPAHPRPSPRASRLPLHSLTGGGPASRRPSTRAPGSCPGRTLAIRLSIRRALLASLLALPGFHAGFLFLAGVMCLLAGFINPPVTALMIYRRLVSGFENRKVQFVPLEKLPKYVPRMFVKVEDSPFYQHHGIDPQAIQDAYRINERLGYVYYGGSTITQQLARTLFLTPTRSYLRKYLEALVALEMDLLLSKRRILELYVNYIEYGKGVYGIGAAARYHYGKSLNRLSVDEYRRLVTIIASPLKYGPKTINRRKALAERYEYLLQAFP